MTENERLNEALEDFEMFCKGKILCVTGEALNMVISAVKKSQAFEAIGTIEEFQALKEKNVAKKPRWHGHHFCPHCNSIVYVNGGKDIYCPKCGQKLDWQ